MNDVDLCSADIYDEMIDDIDYDGDDDDGGDDDDDDDDDHSM